MGAALALIGEEALGLGAEEIAAGSTESGFLSDLAPEIESIGSSEIPAVESEPLLQAGEKEAEAAKAFESATSEAGDVLEDLPNVESEVRTEEEAIETGNNYFKKILEVSLFTWCCKLTSYAFS